MPVPPHFPAPGGPKGDEGPYRAAGEAAPESSGIKGGPAIHASDVEWQPPDPTLARLLVAKASAEAPLPSRGPSPLMLVALCGAAVVLHSTFGRGARPLIAILVVGWAVFEILRSWHRSRGP